MYLDKNPRPICKRLRTPAIITDSSIKAQKALKSIPKYRNKKPSEITEYFDTLSQHILFIIYATTDDEEIKDIIYKYITHWMKVKPFTNGEDLRKMGIPPGPTYKKILSRLRKAWLDQEILNIDHEHILLDEVISSINENE
jgi:tRNA nucleotidyltransferase (CCA-adding enzyme)